MEDKIYYKAIFITRPKKSFSVVVDKELKSPEYLKTVYEYTKQNGESGLVAIRESKQDAIDAIKNALMENPKYEDMLNIIKQYVDSKI